MVVQHKLKLCDFISALKSCPKTDNFVVYIEEQGNVKIAKKLSLGFDENKVILIFK